MQRVASREYFQWRLSKRIQGIAMEDASATNSPRIIKALEIFCMSNWSKGVGWPSLYGRCLTENDRFFLNKLDTDFQRINVPDSDNKIKRILREIQQSRTRYEKEGDRELIIKESSNHIRVGKLTEKKTPRIRKMLEVSGLYATAAVILRYQAAMADSTQWSIPDSVYEILMNDLDCSAEGFASPLNSFMFLKDKPYCSLFSDVDSNFNSLGPISSVLEPQQVSKSWVLNPPYTLYHLNNASNIAGKWLRQHADMRIVLIGREHDTSHVGEPSRFKMQTTSPYSAIQPFARARIDLPAGGYTYTNSKGKSVVANFGSVMYICGRPLQQGDEVLQKIVDNFMTNDVSVV